MLASVTSSTKDLIANLSFDVVILIALVGFFFLLGLRSGKTKLINIVFSTYVAGLLLIAFPFHSAISFDFGLLFSKYNVVDLGILVILIIIIQVVLDYVLELEFDGATIKRTFHSLILSASTAVAFLAVAYMTNVVRNTDTTGSFLDATFANEQYLFGLLVLPLVGVFLVAR